MEFLLFRGRFRERTLHLGTRDKGDLDIQLNATTCETYVLKRADEDYFAEG